MRIIHGQGYSDKDRAEFKVQVYRNIYMGMQILIDAMDHLKISYSNPESKVSTYVVVMPYLCYCRMSLYEQEYIGMSHIAMGLETHYFHKTPITVQTWQSQISPLWRRKLSYDFLHAKLPVFFKEGRQEALYMEAKKLRYQNLWASLSLTGPWCMYNTNCCTATVVLSPSSCPRCG